MPKIERELSGGPTADSTDPFSRVRPVGQLRKGITLNAYGQTGSGKTRLACTFPKPVLVCGTEDGTKSVSNVAGVDFVRVERIDDLVKLTEGVRAGRGSCWDLVAGSDGKKVWVEVEPGRGKPYRSDVVDTAGGVQNLILKEVLCLDQVPLARSWGMADQQTWGCIGVQFMEHMSRLLDLATEVGTNVVVIAHERDFRKDGDTSSGPSRGPGLTPMAADWLNGACDYIGQCFHRQRVRREKVGVGEDAVEMDTPTGVFEWRLRIGPSEVFRTKFRTPHDLQRLLVGADSIADPTYAKIVALIEGRKP